MQETIREVRKGSEAVKISILDTQDQDQELREIKFSQTDSCLVEILRNLLNNENSVKVVTPSGSIHFSKIHRSALRKLTIDLLYF